MRLVFLALLLMACYRVPDRLDPRISYPVQDHYFANLTSAFSPLSPEDQRSDWGKEYTIARAFAEDLDLYRSVSTFKRAEILLPDGEINLQYP